MKPVIFQPETLLYTAEGKPVPAPLGDPVSIVRSASLTSSARATNRIGVWECSPGRWRRQIVQAEFCHFLEGRATFTPDTGEAIEIKAGDVVHFPENSLGVWDIHETSRKIFMVFDEEPSA
ncbi:MULTISPECIES: cupin domain-containing protein [unclassified Novosphingobium]|uniref:cupin domain-containing protein n=1 Tax=unclassified Novosphingobium TaxID=2644732 RepID=UPI00149427D0|nr:MULTISPECIES: cupin domain-containing protein [unclassified Novosphingobium]MBB3359881.1 hypothetical protein [Novosphingobium sp. BK256]MBB3376240.1 hypothetical protein [Novosphingobium sp. BK280]MBB3380654.1 hypothetical protein [Novosphingobium sp. BK258]MBB3422350.1 hypothetical protein [Novosphingobium sp. BK267]MBB3451050.1 hypothetical protein [Novosphingobium sp. BK352]